MVYRNRNGFHAIMALWLQCLVLGSKQCNASCRTMWKNNTEGIEALQIYSEYICSCTWFLRENVNKEDS